jgi:hypothetical protein
MSSFGHHFTTPANDKMTAVKWRPPSSRPSWKEWHDQKARNTTRAQAFHTQTRPRVAAGSTRPQEGHQNCPSSRALSINLPTLSLGTGRPGGKGDIDGHKTINLLLRHNKSFSPVVLGFQPAFPPSPAGLHASAGAEDARKRESPKARSRQKRLKSWANKEGRKKTLQFKIRCLVDSTHFHSLMLVNTTSFPPIVLRCLASLPPSLPGPLSPHLFLIRNRKESLLLLLWLLLL